MRYFKVVRMYPLTSWAVIVALLTQGPYIVTAQNGEELFYTFVYLVGFFCLFHVVLKMVEGFDREFQLSMAVFLGLYPFFTTIPEVFLVEYMDELSVNLLTEMTGVILIFSVVYLRSRLRRGKDVAVYGLSLAVMYGLMLSNIWDFIQDHINDLMLNAYPEILGTVVTIFVLDNALLSLEKNKPLYPNKKQVESRGKHK